MDQNYQPYQTEQFYEPPAKKNASYFRARARAALKHCYWYAVLAFLLASLLGGVVSGSTSVSFDGSGSEEDMNAFTYDEEIEQILEAETLGEAWDRLLEILPGEAKLVFTVAAIAVVVAVVVALAFSIFVSSPMKLGYQRYCLNVMDGNGKDISVLFNYFKHGYGKSIGLNVLYGLLMFAVSLPLLALMIFLVIPSVLEVIFTGGNDATHDAYFQLGLSVLLMFAVAVVTVIVEIILQYRYAYCFMILAEYPEMRVVDAFRNSASMMKGNKFRLFCLQFSFIGWILLAVLCPFGIGMFFLSPYMQAANAAFYDDITNRAAARETEFPSLDPDDYVV